MVFFSFSLNNNSINCITEKIYSNKKYYSKSIDLWKELNNKKGIYQVNQLKRERRHKTDFIGKKILIYLPPKYGLGDAIEYSIAIQSLIKSKKFDKIGIAFCYDYLYIFKNLFNFKNVFSQVISDDEIKNFDTVFHITLEIQSLKFQKYSRSNIVLEICKKFNIPEDKCKIFKKLNKKKSPDTISIFPVSTSVIRSLPYTFLDRLIEALKNDFNFKIVIDESQFSNHLEDKLVDKKNYKFVKPKRLRDLVDEVSNTTFGIFVDSGPLHLAKILDINGVLVETSVSSDLLLNNNHNISAVKNDYTSNFCAGPCGLVDIFSFENKVGCYETVETTSKKILELENLKNLQRFDKKKKIKHFILNPVGCINNISVNKLIDLLKTKIKGKE